MTHDITVFLGEIIARDDADFAAWAIDHLEIDLAAAWYALDEDERDWLVDEGVVRVVAPVVYCVRAQEWSDDWRPEASAAWPTYDLEVVAPGMERLKLTGWHLVGVDDHREWCWNVANGDGVTYGLPCLNGWDIQSGDDVGVDRSIPCWRHDGRWCTLDRDALERGISAAADGADHGREPTWGDVAEDDLEVTEEIYLLCDYEIVEAQVLRGGVAPCRVETEYGRSIEYLAEAWSHSLADGYIWATEEEARADLREHTQDAAIYDDARTAGAELLSLARDAIGCTTDLPDGLVWGEDDDGIYVAEDHEEDDAEQYHLDDAELAAVARAGSWMPLVDVLAGALGRRKLLDMSRRWQEEMDAVLAEYDVFVGVADSVAGGNCPRGTKDFAMDAAAKLGAGELGGARASLILSLRDDAFTRRACRMAAQRYLETRR